MANKNPNTEPLLRSIEDKKQKTKQKVESTIKDMIKQKEKINFNSVSAKSGVSKPFLYKYSEIRTRIETLRKQEEKLDSPNQVKRNVTEHSKDVVIASLRKKVKHLEEENQKLKEQLKVDWAAIYNEIN
jgi:NADH dehydrogenase/NADH:ubiquinone oxidoreductase subunit G